DAVWLAAEAPAALRLLDDEAFSPRDDEILRRIAGAWSAVVAATLATPTTLRQWATNGIASNDTASAGTSTTDWVAAWTRDQQLWSADVDTTGLLQPQRFAETRRLLGELDRAGLSEFSEQLATAAIPAAAAEEALQRGLARASLEERAAAGDLRSFDGDGHDRAAAAYLREGAALRQHLRTAIAARLIAQRPFDADNLHGEVAELARQIERKRGGLAFREVARRYPRALTSITPCFLMSPGSVAHFLDADSVQFDLVIFDEASQIRVPQAIGAMGRGKAVIVVGDSRQMPPTRIMQVDAVSESDTSSEDVVVEDLESILTESVESGLPQLWLNWHYRSQDESLIAFSNATYYQDKLVSLPSPRTVDDTGLRWRRVNGVFDRGRTRTNAVEADAIVEEIRTRLADPTSADDSLGVVCFNIQQRDLILNKLEDTADPLVLRALAAPAGRDLFVKNLENVQGDERDTILFSLAFSLDPDSGRLPLNFGPLSLSGGERRLNVAVTRARKQIVLFSSFDPSDIDLSRSSAQGIADLKHYLEFAATRSLTRRERQDVAVSNRGRLINEIAGHLTDAGYEVETDLGMSSFRVDLAVRDRGTDHWRMAVMVDGPGWASRPTVSDRDGSPNLLVDLMGWPALTRIWLPEWLRDRDGVLAELTAALSQHPEYDPVDNETVHHR
ncbi:MAG: AAA domain-containing protein, partial [Glaciihabitans sp.]